MLAALLASAAVVAHPQQLSLQPFAQGLRPLTAIASTPAEPRRLYAVEQTGRIVYFVNGKLSGTFVDLRRRITSGGEQGLLSLAFSPNYRRNHRFYVNYTDTRGNTRVVEFRSRSAFATRGGSHVRQP
jgi:glucose/arabinose dehydrogenase